MPMKKHSYDDPHRSLNEPRLHFFGPGRDKAPSFNLIGFGIVALVFLAALLSLLD
jgi:hypothetical protein